MEKKKYRIKSRGITLIALIITIIVLLILAGVSLSLVMNGGILEKSQLAVNEYQKVANEEKNELDNIDKYIENKLNEIGLGEDDGIIEVGDIVTAGDIASVNDKSDIYGAIVEGYNCANNNGVDAWKIFYADSENIYLITSDYIHKDYCPNGRKNTPIDGTEYKLNMTGVVNDYSGASDIEDERIKKLNKDYFITKGYVSDKNNMKAVAYMLDTDAWSGFRDIDNADYAIGGPTIEMFFNSYNQKYNLNNQYQAEAKNQYGYQISPNGGVNWVDQISYASIGILQTDDFYVLSDWRKAYGMWIASTSSYNFIDIFDSIFQIYYTGYIENYYYDMEDFGFRPVVCLNPDVQLEKLENGHYLIK